MVFKLGMTVDLCMAYVPKLVSMTLLWVQSHSGSGDETKSALNYLDN